VEHGEKYQGRFWHLLKFVNVVLVFCFFILCFGAYCSFFDKRIPVPAPILNIVDGFLSKNGIKADFSDIRFGLDFSVVAENVTLRARGTPENFFMARRVSAGLNLKDIIFGGMPVRYVAVVDGALSTSYSDVRKLPIVKNIEVMLLLSQSRYSLDFLKFNVHDMAFSIKGKVDEGFSVVDFERLKNVIAKKMANKPSEKPTKKGDLFQQYDEILANCETIKKYLNYFANPSVDVELGLLRDGGNFINIDFKSVGVNVDNLANAKNLKATLRYAHTNTVEKITANVSADYLDAPKYNVSIGNVNARTGVHVNENDIALFDVKLSIAQGILDGTIIDNVIVSKNMLTMSSYKNDWNFFVAGENSRLSGNISIGENNKIICKFDGDIDLNPLFTRKELADIPEMKDFSFPHGMSISGWVSYKVGDTFPDVDVRIDASDCEIMRLAVDYVSADVCLKDGILDCSNIKAKNKEGWGAEGRFIQNFKNYAYDITVKGNLRPMAIAHFMEPWWTKVMGAFTFANKSVYPYADVRVEGVWGAPENIWCFGFVEGENALYNGAKFEDFSLFVWVNPQRITLYDIDILAGKGMRKGHCFIEWLYDAGNGLTSYDRQRLFLRSNLNDVELIALGGDDAKEVLDVVKFSVPPDLILNGLMFNPDNNPKKLRDIFNADVSVQGKTSVEMIDVYNATFSARSDTINTEVFDASFIFCGGKSTGNVYLQKRDKTMFVDGTAKANGMNQGMFFDFLSSLGNETNKEKQSNAKKEEILGGSSNGEVHAEIALKGDVKNMSKAIGKGNISIDSRDFLKLNLFGRISKAFRSINLPVGSFDITNVVSEFTLEDEQLRLSPIQMTGPALRVVGVASYALNDDSIKGELKTYPFDKVDNILVSAVNKLVNPLADTVRITVSGTLENPDFSAKITPADVIRSEKKVIEKIDKSL